MKVYITSFGLNVLLLVLAVFKFLTCLAVLEFNFWHSSYNEVISTMGIDPGFYARDTWAKRDRQWLYFANVKSSSYKEKTIRRRAQKHAFEDQQERAEGTLYKSGSFLETSETSPPLPTWPRGCPRVQEKNGSDRLLGSQATERNT